MHQWPNDPHKVSQSFSQSAIQPVRRRETGRETRHTQIERERRREFSPTDGYSVLVSRWQSRTGDSLRDVPNNDEEVRLYRYTTFDTIMIMPHCLSHDSSLSLCKPLLYPVNRVIQYWLDKSTIHVVPRWCLFVFLLALFFLRIYIVQGYFIVAYGLGIFLLNNFIAFLSPLEDPSEGPSLPTTAGEGKEYRPFTRRLPEFKFWLACARGTATCIVMSFFSVFDVPVFWPILLMYFFILFFMTMKRQIAHMWKHKYVPVSFGKTKYKDAGVENTMYGGGMGKSK